MARDPHRVGALLHPRESAQPAARDLRAGVVDEVHRADALVEGRVGRKGELFAEDLVLALGLFDLRLPVARRLEAPRDVLVPGLGEDVLERPDAIADPALSQEDGPDDMDVEPRRLVREERLERGDAFAAADLVCGAFPGVTVAVVRIGGAEDPGRLAEDVVRDGRVLQPVGLHRRAHFRARRDLGKGERPRHLEDEHLVFALLLLAAVGLRLRRMFRRTLRVERLRPFDRECLVALRRDPERCVSGSPDRSEVSAPDVSVHGVPGDAEHGGDVLEADDAGESAQVRRAVPEDLERDGDPFGRKLVVEREDGFEGFFGCDLHGFGSSAFDGSIITPVRTVRKRERSHGKGSAFRPFE